MKVGQYSSPVKHPEEESDSRSISKLGFSLANDRPGFSCANCT